ncbi:MarR family winged helix-turn-helix transcriptional regulator [Culicoidibacter larvae]|uniref:MarR family transcriptional regulator n=1 Tax=Culicoidibacter larvae TaxID=2579976 RepID=A0A5R8QGA2_9FIRM|nr:MarR family transcriptional regulator [Culicoidibacter larvae]TLG76804.1 MarR family transcriptional regulator [Culicoidibacter larvae]
MSEQTKNLMEQLRRYEALLHRYLRFKHATKGKFGDPHRGQGRVLAILKMQSEISQKELAYLLDMRAQSLGELLVKLERNGYITRTASSEDRRVMLVALTDAGRKAAEETTQNSFEGDNLFSVLNEEEQAQLGDYLARLIVALEKEVDAYDIPDRNFSDFAGGKNHRRHNPFNFGHGGRHPFPEGFPFDDEDNNDQ